MSQRNGNSRDGIINEQLSRATREVIQLIPHMNMVFRNPKYDLKQTVENDLDFLLGAVLATILERNTTYCLNRNIKPTLPEGEIINYAIFSQAKEFREIIQKELGI
jgi:hypothetical protein